MTAGERYGRLINKVEALVAAKQHELDERHPQLSGVLADLSATRREPFDPRGIVLGRDEHDMPLVLPERARLEHMHVIGATGSGKSNLLEHMIWQDILLGRGVCLVDPHGNHPDSLYRSLLVWMARQGLDKSWTVHLIDPNASSHSVGFNPLDRGDPTTAFSVVAEAMFEAFERMWGDEDGNAKPTIQRVLTATFTALGEQGLTLAEARLLFDPEDTRGIRALVRGKLEDSYAYDEIDWLHRIGREKGGRRDFRAEVVGPINRIAKLVRTQAVRAIVGQTENVIDLRQAMDEGHILLCNLSGGAQVYEQGADLLGRLLTRFLFFHARRRTDTKRMFAVYLDECHRYLSGDVPNILAEVRKYGVAICAGHQWLAQMGRRDDPVREAICKGPNIKVVFRIKDPTEAAELAEAVTPLNLELPVQALVKPTVIGHRRTAFRNQSSGQQWARTDTKGTSHATSIAHTEGESWAQTETESTSTTETKGTSSTETDSSSHSELESAEASYGYSTSESWDSASSVSDTYDNPGMMKIYPDAQTISRGSGISGARSSSEGYSRGEFETDSFGTSSSATESSSTSETHGHSTSITHGRSRAITRGETTGTSASVGITSGGSESSGISEGIEPLYATLPSAVHSKENVLYMAAQELLSLPTGTARIAYVGPSGRVTTRMRVPRVAQITIDDAEFAIIRNRVLEQSGSAVPMRDAIAILEQRE